MLNPSYICIELDGSGGFEDKKEAGGLGNGLGELDEEEEDIEMFWYRRRDRRGGERDWWMCGGEGNEGYMEKEAWLEGFLWIGVTITNFELEERFWSMDFDLFFYEKMIKWGIGEWVRIRCRKE